MHATKRSVNMPKKRKGELPSGNIRRQVFVGWKPKTDKDGKPILDEKGNQVMKRAYESITASTVAEANLLAAQLKADTNRKAIVDMTLKEAIDKYIDLLRVTRSPKTIEGYEVIRDNAFQSIMDKNLKKLDNETLQTAINIECNRISTATSNKKKKNPISPKTVRNEWGLISSVLNKYAPTLNISVTLPGYKPKVNELSKPEDIFKIVKGTEIELPVLLAMWLSFSMSEIKGLTKSSSIKGDYLYIDKVTVTTKSGEITKDIGKNSTRNRMHRIPPYIKELIDKVETDELVTLTAATIKGRFTRLLKKNGLPHMSFHDLRHVNASVMSFLNIPDKYAMERGGWSTDKVMKGTYMQVYNSERIKVDDNIDNYFESTLLNKKEVDEKYIAYLTLFGKEDSKESKKEYEEFILCNTKCNTKKKNP